MGHLLRAARRVDVAAGLYAVAYFAWLAIRTPGTPSTVLVGASAFYPLGPAVAWVCWLNSRLPGTDRRTRTAWQLLTASVLSLWVSGSAWDIYRQVVGLRGWPAWVDHLEALQHPLAIAAFLVFPRRSFVGRDRTRFLLDAGLVVVAGSVIAVYFGFTLWVTQLQGESLWSAIQGPGLDWVVLVIVAIGSLEKRDAATRGSLSLMVLASTSYIVANYYFTVAHYGRDPSPYRPGDAVDGLWFAAWVLRWAAVRWYWHRRSSPLPDAPDAVGASGHYESSRTAYLVVGGCFILLTGQASRGDPLPVGLLSFSAMIMVALLLARQLIELRESERLFEEQVAQEALFRSLVDRSSDAVLVLDGGGVVAYASSTASAVFGAQSPIRVGTRLVDAVRDDDGAVLQPALDGRAASGRLLMHVPAGNNAWREVEAVWTDRRRDPAVNGIVVNCRDLTEQRELERQLQHAQKLDAVGQLAGGLAHDINNALAVVRGYAELLKDELEPGSAGASDLAHVEQAVDRAASITRKVLAFSRRQAAQPTVLDLSAIVRELLPLLRQSVTPQVDVQLELEPALWAVRADRGQMEQVLVNLAANARDAMADGGVLTFTTSNRVVASESAATAGLPPGDYAALTVRDQGTGISPDVLARIFEPFFSTKTAAGGMGLGLAMVHDIVQGGGGGIVVNTAPGGGAAFTIFLPRTLAAVVSDETASAPEERRARGTVLIVDDEENVRTVARRMLERHGYDVLEAASGLLALDTIGSATTRIDVLLTDLVMPGLDGRQLIARCAELRPSLPVICMTGFAGDDEHPTRYGDNLVALLSKPFSSEALLATVGAAVSRVAAP